MDGSCPTRVTNGTTGLRHALGGALLALLAGLLLSLSFSLPAEAATSAPMASKAIDRAPPIAAFDTTYRFQIAGFPFSIEGRRTLKPMDNGLWQMQILADNFIGEIRETALFRWHGCTPVTTFYGYRRQGFGRIKSAEVHIDPSSRIATSERSGHKPATFKVSEATTDKISVALALQCRLNRGDKTLSLSVADERGPSQERYIIDGKEKLEIDGHILNTLRLRRVRSGDSDRQTLLWFAPERDYTLVQLVQKNHDGRHVMTLELPQS